MPHSAPNIPESSPHHVKSETLNGILNAVKGAATNFFSGGINANSTSSGNSVNASDLESERSFWAVITRRLRYFSKPSLSYLRISKSERIRKFSSPTTPYDIPGWYKVSNGLWITDQEKSPDSTAIQLWRNPWDSYDGYVREDGKWDEDLQQPFFERRGTSESRRHYYAPKENRYVEYGPWKGTYPGVAAGGNNSNAGTPEWEYFCGYCPQFIWCYGWAEIIDALDLTRRDSIIAPINNYQGRPTPDPRYLSRHPAPWQQDPNIQFEDTVPKPKRYYCYLNCAPALYMSHGGEFGNAMAENRAHEVNNGMSVTGSVVRMWKGKGSYHLFSEPQYPKGSNFYMPVGGDGSFGTSGVENAPYHFWKYAHNPFHMW